jgi:hypothetical protein
MQTLVRALVVCAATFPIAAMAVVPINGPSPSSAVVTINNSPGTQDDPHVSVDLVSYTDQSSFPQIRYYNFVTGIDSAIDNLLPDGTYGVDVLSDVSGHNVVFTRQAGGASRIMIFNTDTGTTTEVDPTTTPQRMGVALGGNTVAYIDISNTGDVVAWDLATSTRQVVSADAAFESNPNVSPDGNVIVWEYCLTSTTNCDAYQAVKSAGSWVVSPTANTATPEANPDTDGTTIVYDADRAGSATGQDIFFRAVAGGPETQIELPGLQRNPSISQGVVAFESVAPGAVNADVFLYIINTNTLLQVTNTPGNESLNDVTVLANGDVRVVWAANGDIVGTTFTPPPPVNCHIIRLDQLVARDGRAVIPYTGTDAGQGGTGLRLTSLGKIRNTVGQTLFTVWSILNSSTQARTVTLTHRDLWGGALNSFQLPLTLPPTTETIVTSPVVAGVALHSLWEGARVIDLKTASQAVYSDARMVPDPKSYVYNCH